MTPVPLFPQGSSESCLPTASRSAWSESTSSRLMDSSPKTPMGRYKWRKGEKCRRGWLENVTRIRYSWLGYSLRSRSKDFYKGGYKWYQVNGRWHELTESLLFSVWPVCEDHAGEEVSQRPWKLHPLYTGPSLWKVRTLMPLWYVPLPPLSVYLCLKPKDWTSPILPTRRRSTDFQSLWSRGRLP